MQPYSVASTMFAGDMVAGDINRPAAAHARKLG